MPTSRRSPSVTRTAPTRWSRMWRQASLTVAWAGRATGSWFLTISDIFLMMTNLPAHRRLIFGRLLPRRNRPALIWIKYEAAPAPSLRARSHTGREGEPHQLGQAAGPHLVHYARPVNLDRARAYRQVVGDRFVGQPRDEAGENLPLSRREQR